jgi:hypothetical protein
MVENKSSECLNCTKVGCHGVRHRMCADKKGAMPRLVTECQWCEARLVVKSKHTWIEYLAIVMLFTPLAILEYRPHTPWIYLALVVILALALIVWAKLGVSYHLAHKVEEELAEREAEKLAEKSKRSGQVST